MSGGVDSSVAVFLLKEAGYEVEGVSLMLFDSGSCCSIEAIAGAGLTARKLSVPHHTLDARERFRQTVIAPFLDAYSKGLTPNPCILCNRHVKFPVILEEARKRGIDFIATGHYARIERSEGPPGGALLKTGIDPGKDQSYVLYMLNEEELDALVLPLGRYMKTDVRRLAHELGLPAAKRPESQEICFVGDGRYADFVVEALPPPESSGPIIDDRGGKIGVHRGIYRYTIGQRKALGISSRRPLYVTKIDVAANALHVGPREAAMAREFTVGDLNWIITANDDFRATVKVRSMMEARPARVLKDGNRVHVICDEPQWAPAPGQSAVFYDGDTVMGGGVIGGQ